MLIQVVAHPVRNDRAAAKLTSITYLPHSASLFRADMQTWLYLSMLMQSTTHFREITVTIHWEEFESQDKV